MLKLKQSSLPNLSNKVGHDVRTNNKSLIAVTSLENDCDFSKGLAIGAILRGKAMAFGLTPLAGIPGTAHILGGAVMGNNPASGVIDRDNRVFGYENLLVCDGAMISANPGVTPSLSITAIAERAMSKVPGKE